MQKQYPLDIPAIVQRAKRAAAKAGFDLRPEGTVGEASKLCASVCLDEAGSFLRTLTVSLPHGHIGEVGTGAGVGSAWIASGLANTAKLTSVELDPDLAGVARGLFEDKSNVEVLAGDWLGVMPPVAPFDLVFSDGGGPQALQPDTWQTVTSLLKPSGMRVIDDLTPEEDWPESWRGQPDAKRELAFNSGLFTATELRSRPDVALLLLVRRAS